MATKEVGIIILDLLIHLLMLIKEIPLLPGLSGVSKDISEPKMFFHTINKKKIFYIVKKKQHLDFSLFND